MLLTVLAAFAVSLVTTLLIVRGVASGGGSGTALDHQMDGPQKFHAAPVPRTGGVAIIFGLAAALLLLSLNDHAAARTGGWLLLCAAPVFGAGLVEDLTKKVGPAARLLASIVSALLASWLLGSILPATGIPALDLLLATTAGAVALTAFVVAGMSNAVNIIDGFNGLASMCAVLMLAALAYVAFKVGDSLVMALALGMIGAILGFFVCNFPAGLVFLGDGGAYVLGFWFAELSVLLLLRNPGEVSPLTPLLIGIYPVFETLFSIYRRRLRGTSPGFPDGIHLHTLIYRRVLRWAVADRTARAMTLRNSMTAPYLWFVCMLSIIPAMLFWDNTTIIATFLCLFVLSYLGLYWRIVRFQSPGWLHATKRRLLRQPWK
jgi:UDP-N-acetylmuramyl pentapeptide phosphotransferase/UDP-N-acetylglucosamine-1-phosphate transferase